MNSRLPLKIAVLPKIADYFLWHHGPTRLLTRFVLTYFKKLVMRGALTLWGTTYPLLNQK